MDGGYIPPGYTPKPKEPIPDTRFRRVNWATPATVIQSIQSTGTTDTLPYDDLPKEKVDAKDKKDVPESYYSKIKLKQWMKRKDSGKPHPDVMKRLKEENEKPYRQKRLESFQEVFRAVKATTAPVANKKYAEIHPYMNTPQQCPFVPDHCYTMGQYGAKHLILCRRSNEQLFRTQFEQCEFNFMHYVKKGSMKDHLDTCLYYQRWAYRQAVEGLPFSIAEEIAVVTKRVNAKLESKANSSSNANPEDLPVTDNVKVTDKKKLNKGESYDWDDDS